MRLTRLLIASLFIFFFAFGIRTQAFAQALPDQRCSQDAVGANQILTCQQCRNDVPPGHANDPICKHWIDTWGNNLTGLSIEQTDARKAALAGCANGNVFRNTYVGGLLGKCSNGTTSRPGIVGDIFQSLVDYISTIPGSATTVASNGQEVTITYGGGAIYQLNNLTAQVVGKPQISTTEYIADLRHSIQNPLGAQTAYAQGLGFSSLAPALALWKVFRNIAYFFFVVIFLVIGFMIMFRSKIGGQAAVTVQQALPKIIVSLLLVTFSYAIAGLLIDIMYLVIYLIIGIFNPFFANGTAGGSMFGGESLTKIAFQNNIVQNTLSLITNGAVGNVAGALGNITVGALGLSPDQLGGQALQGLANITFTLILAVVVLVAIFKVFLALLQAYIFVFFAVIFAPLQLLIGAIPGQNTFGTWIRSLLENLLVFPTIILMIFIAYFFTGPYGAQTGVGTNLGFSAPQLTSNQGAQGFSVYQSLIALGAILAMPEVLKVTKGLMKGEVGVSVGDLYNNFKSGVPLGSRLALTPAAAIGAGGLAFGRDLFASARSNGLRGADYQGALEQARIAAFGGKNKAGKEVAGATAGAISAASFISKGLGANQPDILNPITDRIDRRLNPKVAEEQRKLQEIEDALERLRLTNRGKQ